jgi:hypothetical protein
MRPIDVIILIGLALGACGFGLGPIGLEPAATGAAQTLGDAPTHVRGLAWNH